jgi:hypothetical protein
LHRKGLISKIEFNTWQNTWDYFYLEISQFKLLYQERLLRLKQKIGLKLNSNIEIKEPKEEIFMSNIEKNKLEELINWALKNRLEFIILQKKQAIDKNRAIYEVPSYIGEIFGKYKWEGKDFPLTDTEWKVGININIPVWSFSLRSGFTRQKLLKGTKPETDVEKIGIDLFGKEQILQEIKADSFNLDLFDTKSKYYELKEKVISEITRNFIELKISETKREITRNRESLKNKEFEKSQIDYEAGKISRIKLIEKKMDKIRSNVERLMSEWEYQINLLSLEEVIGINACK